VVAREWHHEKKTHGKHQEYPVGDKKVTGGGAVRYTEAQKNGKICKKGKKVPYLGQVDKEGGLKGNRKKEEKRELRW